MSRLVQSFPNTPRRRYPGTLHLELYSGTLRTFKRRHFKWLVKLAVMSFIYEEEIPFGMRTPPEYEFVDIQGTIEGDEEFIPTETLSFDFNNIDHNEIIYGAPAPTYIPTHPSSQPWNSLYPSEGLIVVDAEPMTSEDSGFRETQPSNSFFDQPLAWVTTRTSDNAHVVPNLPQGSRRSNRQHYDDRKSLTSRGVYAPTSPIMLRNDSARRLAGLERDEEEEGEEEEFYEYATK
ncbi:uncharacterized protein LOC143036543 [Oratosquilla oratoria]|uniref:uncharacterized protein LOC143036543 n=1 Tax=Oratosquilla oratoria TaxID=337810 RepID=UPI003F765BA9